MARPKPWLAGPAPQTTVTNVKQVGCLLTARHADAVRTLPINSTKRTRLPRRRPKAVILGVKPPREQPYCLI
jgi:hypothetical protein